MLRSEQDYETEYELVCIDCKSPVYDGKLVEEYGKLMCECKERWKPNEGDTDATIDWPKSWQYVERKIAIPSEEEQTNVNQTE